MALSNYLRRKSKTTTSRQHYSQQHHIKTGVKILPQHGMTAMDRKAKGKAWSKTGRYSWKAWNGHPSSVMIRRVCFALDKNIFQRY